MCTTACRYIARFAGRNVVVAGGGDSALDWALALRGVARRVTLVHRRNGFSAAVSSVEQMKRAVEAGEMDFMVGAIGALNAPGGTLESVELKQIGGTAQVEAEHVIALYGLVADLGPIANWGIEGVAGKLTVDTSNYETSRPGIFAVGDVANYPNKQKLILSGLSRGIARASPGVDVRVSGQKARPRPFQLRHETRRKSRRSRKLGAAAAEARPVPPPLLQFSFDSI